MVSWETRVEVPAVLLAIMASLIAFPIMAIFRGWIVPGVFYRREVARGDAERAAKDDALEANKTLTETNNSLLRRDDVSLTTIIEIRDYIYRHANDHPPPPKGEGGGSP